MSPPLFTEDDHAFMRRALELGLGQMGRTWPNPAVGCVIVREGQIIAEGATGDGGRPHAEEVALDAAGELARGATAYVTLEPCGERSHGGRSCSQKLVEAGVARVVYACDDPHPLAAQKGLARFAEAGIQVETGLLPHASILIEGFVHHLKTGRPMVMETTGPEMIDAWFTADPAADLKGELEGWGATGYRTLGVVFGSPLAQALREQGLLSEN